MVCKWRVKTVIKNITKGNLCVASCDYSGIVFSWEVIKVRKGERENEKLEQNPTWTLALSATSFSISTLLPFSKFPVPRSQGSLNIPLSWRFQVDCWPFWTPPWGPQPCIEREYLSHKWRMRAGDNRKSSNTVEPCVKQTPFVKRTVGLVCFKRFFLHFLLNESLCSENQWGPQASLRSKCRNGRKGKREGDWGERGKGRRSLPFSISRFSSSNHPPPRFAPATFNPH